MKKFISLISLTALLFTSLGCVSFADAEELKAQMQSLYGVNEEITDGDYDESLAAKCTNGTFVGLKENGVISYKGIPYAKSPTGELRWKAPVLASDDDGVYQAYYYGASPIQTEWPSEAGSYYTQSEDCLTLNIWTSNETQSEGKAVMVFFHGGSYGWGGTSDPLYDGQNFVEEYDDVILVTVEYRTGILGFIDFSSVEGGEDYAQSGNLGLLDCVCALEWISQNIEAFGGDPDNVTIFGESAGAGIVSLIPLIESANGLYNRVIAESGSVALTYSTDECQTLTQMLLEETGATCMDDLLALTEEELIELNETLNDYNNFPERDGVVLPVDLYEAYAELDTTGLEMLIGTNADECRYWITEMGYYIDGIDGLPIYKIGMTLLYNINTGEFSDEDLAYAEAFMALQSDEKIWNITEFYNEAIFRVPALYQALYFSENGGTSYSYYWTYPSEYENLGACHAVELAYVFNNLDETIYTGNNIDTSLAKTVQQMWVNFAKTGDPSTDEYTWESYNSDTRLTMILGEEIYMEADLLSQQRELIEPLLGYGLNGSYMSVFDSLIMYAVYAVIIILVIIAAVVAIIIVVHKRRKKIPREN